jgi:putative transcriptional regulator
MREGEGMGTELDPFREDYPRWLEGQFLISETDLMDPNFHRTVVLMIEHNTNGAFGLVLNRRSTAVIGDLLPEVHGPARDLPVYIGGPVEQQYLFVLHTGPVIEASAERVLRPVDDVVFEPATDAVMGYLTDTWGTASPDARPNLRFYAGCSGWAPGQLENELESGSWMVHTASTDIVFHPDPDSGWDLALSKKGPLHKIVAQTGFKPSMN